MKMNNNEESDAVNILVVDDEEPAVRLITDILESYDSVSEIYTAGDGKEAVETYREYEPDLVITDMLMPRVSGVEMIKKIRSHDPEAHIIVNSAFDDAELVRQAVRAGACDYLFKPFSASEFTKVFDRTLRQVRQLEERNNYMNLLESRIEAAEAKQRKAFLNSLSTLIHVLEARDSYTHEHSHNVTKYAVMIAKHLGLSGKVIHDIEVAGTLHDIGKVGVPDAILLKPDLLTPEEREVITRHPDTGYKIILPVMASHSNIIDFVYHHHERVDGSGYPEGLKADDIPTVARIAAVADAFDAMTSDRPYRNAMAEHEAVEELYNNMGSQFDPDITDAFIELLETARNPQSI